RCAPDRRPAPTAACRPDGTSRSLSSASDRPTPAASLPTPAGYGPGLGSPPGRLARAKPAAVMRTGDDAPRKLTRQPSLCVLVLAMRQGSRHRGIAHLFAHAPIPGPPQPPRVFRRLGSLPSHSRQGLLAPVIPHVSVPRHIADRRPRLALHVVEPSTEPTYFP